MKIYQVTHIVAAPDYTTSGTYHFSNLVGAQTFAFEMFQLPYAEVDGVLDERPLDLFETMSFRKNDHEHRVSINEFTVYDDAHECMAERC